MASKPAFSLSDLLPSNIKVKPVSASASTKGVVRFDVNLSGASNLVAGFESAINRASARIAADLKSALDEALKSGVWTTPEGSADIYETGELLQSGRVSFGANGIEIFYDAPYASLVHFGGYIHPYGNTSAKVYLPPRPWVRSVLEGGGPVPRFDFSKYYLEELRREFGSI